MCETDPSRLADPADQIEAVETDNYPVYNSADLEHQSTFDGFRPSSSRASTPTSSSLRKNGSKPSLEAPRTWLEALASKMRSATEFFHKDTSSVSSGQDDLLPGRASPTKSISSKKSVRFRSNTLSQEPAASSSPMEIPNKKPLPALLPLDLPPNDLLADVTHPVFEDPILTGRPRDTPILAKFAAQGSFFPFPTEIDHKLHTLRADQHVAPLTPIVPGGDDNTTDNKVSALNSGSIEQVAAEGLVATDQSTMADEVIVGAFTTQSKPTVSMHPFEPIENQQNLKRHDDWSQGSESVSEAPSEAHSDDNPFLDTVMIPQPPPSSPEDSPILDPVKPQKLVKKYRGSTEATCLPSPWSLKSRSEANVGNEHSDSSRSPSPRTRRLAHKESFRDLPGATPPARSPKAE
jgi:hypothetical protein